MNNLKISISIVSHGQSSLISLLIDDLNKLNLQDVEVLITLNIPENELIYSKIKFRHVIIRNEYPKGFGSNHNAAFRRSIGEYFIVLNPDIRISLIDFDILISSMKNPRVACVAPKVLNNFGSIEDSLRQFPTFIGLFKRIILRQKGVDYEFFNEPIYVDWTAGMFMLFRREAFAAVRGFDEQRFFMYYEDVDICKRLHQSNMLVVFDPRVSVIHNAQRASHRNFKHLRWHISSAFRYLTGL